MHGSCSPLDLQPRGAPVEALVLGAPPFVERLPEAHRPALGAGAFVPGSIARPRERVHGATSGRTRAGQVHRRMKHDLPGLQGKEPALGGLRASQRWPITNLPARSVSAARVQRYCRGQAISQRHDRAGRPSRVGGAGWGGQGARGAVSEQPAWRVAPRATATAHSWRSQPLCGGGLPEWWRRQHCALDQSGETKRERLFASQYRQRLAALLH